MRRIRVKRAQQTDARGVETSGDFVASRRRAIIGGVGDGARNWSVDASYRDVARRNRAKVRLAHNGSMNTTSRGINGIVARVHGAVIEVVARVEHVRTHARGSIAAIDGALDAIVAVHRDDIVSAGGGITKGGEA
jgi:hypothetical protein